jgi:non-specific serine/threonine protein kinase/serine/threonine-protein kinase
MPAAGSLIGNYRLKEQIGEGGMGEVYLADREGEFRKRVAVKLIRAGMAGTDAVRRFLIERQTLAALNHPQIVRLIDGGATEDGLPYLVVDYVEGVPVDQYCDARKLSVTDRLKLFVEICNAVHYAHQSLIVHCDLKPSNILVTADGVPMLLDFGIAKLLDPVSMGISETVAKTRQRAFTPSYASPEQLLGKPVTTATDVYALGVILFELLTGHSPYPATVAAAPAEWIKSICEGDAERPSTVVHRPVEFDSGGETLGVLTPEQISEMREADPQKLERTLRGDLDAIALKALRKEPRHRYASVDQFAEDIRRHLDGRPVLARRNTAGYVTRKFLRRHKIAVAAAALLAVVIGAGIAATLWEARIAARRFNEVRSLAHTFLFDVHDAIQYLPGATAARALIAKTGAEYLDRLSRDARGDRSLEWELAEGYLKIGDVEGNEYGANLGNTAAAIENYRKAIALAESVLRKNPRDAPAKHTLAVAHRDLASTLPFVGKAPEALDHALAAERIYREILAAHPDDVSAQLDLSGAYDSEGDIQGGPHGSSLAHNAEAKKAFERSLELIPTLPPSHPLAARASRGRAIETVKLGDMAYRAGRLEESMAKYQAALAAAEELAKNDPNNVLMTGLVGLTLGKIAALNTAIQDNPAARDALERALEIDEAILQREPNNEKAIEAVIVTSKNLGDLYMYNLHQPPQAQRAYQRAGELLEARARADPQNVVARQQLSEVLECIASTLIDAGHPAEAKANEKRGIAIAKEVADRAGATADNVYNYAYLAITADFDDLRDPAAVLPYAEKAVKMNNGADPFSLHVLAQTYAAMGDYARAVQTDEKAIARFPPVTPGKPVSKTQEIIGRVLAENRKKLKRD